MGVNSASPDNKAIREQLEEMRKLNRSSTIYNRVIVVLAAATLVVSVIGVIIALTR